MRLHRDLQVLVVGYCPEDVLRKPGTLRAEQHDIALGEGR